MAIDWLLERMSQWRPDPALVWSDQVATYGDIVDLVGSWQDRLDAHQVGAGQVVALRGDYTPRACALLDFNRSQREGVGQKSTARVPQTRLPTHAQIFFPQMRRFHLGDNGR